MVLLKYLLLIGLITTGGAFCQTDSQFEGALKQALKNSPLGPFEKAQHVLDRMGYGPAPELFPLSKLISYNRDGGVEKEASDKLIVDYVRESLKPGIYPQANMEPLVEAFPYSGGTYNSISNEVRKLNNDLKLITDRNEEHKKKGEPLEDEFPKRQELTQFRFGLGTLEQARMLSHAVLVKYPLRHKLLYLWFNRFNVSLDAAGFDLGDYLHQISKNTMGSFYDLAVTVTKHPAMLIYLHNAKNVVLYDKITKLPIAPPVEDHARELLELHLLGKPSGQWSNANSYNLKDVHEVANLLSGWNLGGTLWDTTGDTKDRRFEFKAANHAIGQKMIMGQIFDANCTDKATCKEAGEAGGLALIKFLANHDLAALSVARMLARHFIKDEVGIKIPTQSNSQGYIYEPTDAVVQLSKAFKENKGDLRQVYLTLFSSDDFWSREAYRSKMKDPFHLVVSTLRGTGQNHKTLNQVVQKDGTLDQLVLKDAIVKMRVMNQDLFKCSLPTGYGDTTAIWSSVANIMAFVDYAFERATYSGSRLGYYEKSEEHAARMKASSLKEPPMAKTQEEKDLRLEKASSLMAKTALAGFYDVYNLRGSPLASNPLGLPRENTSRELTLLRYGKTPDIRKVVDTMGITTKVELPVRSIAGGYFGSAEFMKR